LSDLTFLAMSDLEGRHDYISLLADSDLSKYEFILYKGDTPDPQVYKKIRKSRSLGGQPWEERTSTSIMEESEDVKEAFRKAVEDSTKINHLFAVIKKKIPIYGVLGNSDTVPTRIAPLLGLDPVDFSKNIEILHKKFINVKGFTLLGYNGRVKYLDENIVEAPDLMFTEDQAAADLAKLFQQVDPKKTIFVTHVPPYRILDKVNEDWVAYAISTYGEKAKEGHIGSNAFRDAALKFQPLLHTFGHIHETSGVEKHGETTFINGGALGETAEMEMVTIKDGEVSCEWVGISDL
jgi:Icc-related predicted phosphoesterase